MASDPTLDDLVHDVNGKCANLKGGAAQLQVVPEGEALELLSMMAAQARGLAEAISAYEKFRRGRSRK